VFLWASLRALQLSLRYDAELLYGEAMFHDVGLLDGHRSAHERHEIDGANGARAFLERYGLLEERVMTVCGGPSCARHMAVVDVQMPPQNEGRLQAALQLRVGGPDTGILVLSQL
jgi:hypothetical protein